MKDENLDVIESPEEEEAVVRLSAGSMVRSYLELMRLPNVFTAMADVAMGYLFVQSAAWHGDPWWDCWMLAVLAAASSLLYLGGVVLNDVFDLIADLQWRPERPIPSGRVSLRAAQRLGWTLLIAGALLGVAAVSVGTGGGLAKGHFGSVAVAPLLAACIVLYDAWLKRTPGGPLAMGTCRMLNVVLGMSALGTPLGADAWLVAGGLGVYVAGITWFARREAEQSRRLQLALATVLMTLGIVLVALFPRWSDRVIDVVRLDPRRWHLLIGALGLLIGWRCVWAVINPVAAQVRRAVAQCVLSIIVLDAAACYAVRGVYWAGMILLLLLPALFLGRWIEST